MDDTTIEILLTFVVPAIAAIVAIGSPGTKVAWYVGTGVLAFFAAAIVDAMVILRAISLANEAVITILVMLAVNVAMIAMAASSGKKCQACRSRVHPRATRCPKCQANLTSTEAT